MVVGMSFLFNEQVDRKVFCQKLFRAVRTLTPEACRRLTGPVGSRFVKKFLSKRNEFGEPVIGFRLAAGPQSKQAPVKNFHLHTFL